MAKEVTVREMIEFLKNFHDQDAIIEIVSHSSGTGYYDQGGNARVENFDIEKHVEYSDFRGNQFVGPERESYNKRYLQLGEYNG